MRLPADTVTACLALGANQGDRLAQLRMGYEALNQHPAIKITAASPVYASEAHTWEENDTAPDYLNAVVKACTALPPETLLRVCQQIERAAGRDREAAAPDRRWAPRPLDLDILTYARQQIDTQALTVPHPRLGERRFVLQPWSDIAPNLYVPPPFDTTVQELLQQCSDTAALRRTPHALDATSSAPT
jgi:2-amino-4-hydroxy-6-hydroxymethyldihydropteridine diphosphokinase